MSQNDKQGVYEQVGVAMTCRSYQEYTDMFQLTREHLEAGPILDVAAGASSFVAEARRRGVEAVAADPLYQLGPGEMLERGKREIAESARKLGKIAHSYQWEYYGSLEQHQRRREQSLEAFLQAYTEDTAKQVFVPGVLPRLPFADHSFSLVLGSHFLFLYHQQFDHEFHLQAVTELVRVCRPGGQVRLYPLIGLDCQAYAGLPELIAALERMGHEATLVPTAFRFMAGADHFLQITK